MSYAINKRGLRRTQGKSWAGRVSNKCHIWSPNTISQHFFFNVLILANLYKFVHFAFVSVTGLGAGCFFSINRTILYDSQHTNS